VTGTSVRIPLLFAKDTSTAHYCIRKARTKKASSLIRLSMRGLF